MNSVKIQIPEGLTREQAEAVLGGFGLRSMCCDWSTTPPTLTLVEHKSLDRVESLRMRMMIREIAEEL